jgi:hypothetical protein
VRSELDETVDAVCRLPIDYASFRIYSTVELLRRSGYLAVRSEITVDHLAASLAERPDWVDAWVARSAEARARTYWFIRECGPEEWEVAWFDGSANRRSTSFGDRTRACAEYVLRELESIAAGA